MRGWVIEYDNGSIISEEQMEWKNAPKKGIVSMSLIWDDKRWTISGKKHYVPPMKRVSVSFLSNDARVEARSIGFYENGKKVIYRVDENTGQMKIEII